MILWQSLHDTTISALQKQARLSWSSLCKYYNLYSFTKHSYDDDDYEARIKIGTIKFNFEHKAGELSFAYCLQLALFQENLSNLALPDGLILDMLYYY